GLHPRCRKREQIPRLSLSLRLGMTMSASIVITLRLGMTMRWIHNRHWAIENRQSFPPGIHYPVIAMTLMDSQNYDEARDRRRRKLIIIAVVVVLILAWTAYHFRHYPERKAVAQFLEQLQKQN